MRPPEVKSFYFPLGGGLDLLTPAIQMQPGKVFDSQNYEPEVSGGYRRVDGYERVDGRTTTLFFWLIKESCPNLT